MIEISEKISFFLHLENNITLTFFNIFCLNYKKYTLHLKKKKGLAETLEEHIEQYFKANGRLSKQRLVESIKGDFPNWSDNTINMYLSK